MKAADFPQLARIDLGNGAFACIRHPKILEADLLSIEHQVAVFIQAHAASIAFVGFFECLAIFRSGATGVTVGVAVAASRLNPFIHPTITVVIEFIAALIGLGKLLSLTTSPDASTADVEATHGARSADPDIEGFRRAIPARDGGGAQVTWAVGGDLARVAVLHAAAVVVLGGVGVIAVRARLAVLTKTIAITVNALAAGAVAIDPTIVVVAVGSSGAARAVSIPVMIDALLVPSGGDRTGRSFWIRACAQPEDTSDGKGRR